GSDGRARGEWEVRAQVQRAESRFHFRTGIASEVPWLVASDFTAALRNRTGRCGEGRRAPAFALLRQFMFLVLRRLGLTCGRGCSRLVDRPVASRSGMPEIHELPDCVTAVLVDQGRAAGMLDVEDPGEAQVGA